MYLRINKDQILMNVRMNLDEESSLFSPFEAVHMDLDLDRVSTLRRRLPGPHWSETFVVESAFK